MKIVSKYSQQDVSRCQLYPVDLEWPRWLGDEDSPVRADVQPLAHGDQSISGKTGGGRQPQDR